MRGHITLVAVALLIIPDFLRAQSLSESVVTQIERYVSNELVTEHIPGISAGVVRRGALVWSRGFGAANLETSSPATDSTVYAIMSVGKQFTASLVMLLVERGILALDDQIVKYLPDLPASYQSIRIRHLLSHTSGIPDYTSASGWRVAVRLDRTPKELMAPVYAMPLLFEPGTRFRYSNSNYYLLGLLIEAVQKKTFAEAITETIFGPLHMGATRYNSMSDIIPRRATGYAWTPSGFKNDEFVSPSQQWAAGAFVSTVIDLAKWEAAIVHAELLRRETENQMMSPAPMLNGTNQSYGLGNELSNDHGHRVSGHQGGGFGFNATILRYFDDNTSVIVLTNARAGESQTIARHIAAMVIPGISDAANSGIADEDPALTLRHRDIIIDAARGMIDTTLLAPEADKQFPVFVRVAGPRLLGSLGPLRSFVLLENTHTDTRRVRRYRAQYASKSFVWTFELAADGRIISMEPLQE